MTYVYSAFVDTVQEEGIYLGVFSTPEKANRAIDKYISDHGLIEGKNCSGCVVEHYVQ